MAKKKEPKSLLVKERVQTAEGWQRARGKSKPQVKVKKVA